MSKSWKQEHRDVFENLLKEDRDPRFILVQQLWVLLEQHRREKAEGNAGVAAEVLQFARTCYEKGVAQHPQFPPDLLNRLTNLKRELDELLPG